MSIKIGFSRQAESTYGLQSKTPPLPNKNTIATSQQPGSTAALGPIVHLESVDLENVLTKHDKQVLNYAVGGVELKGADGMMKLNFMAINIALDRVNGQLSGEVDSAYMHRLAQTQKLTGDRSIASSSIDRAIDFLEGR